MSEYQIGYLAFGALVGCSLACLAYMAGGRSRKVIRRVAGSLVLAATVNTEALIIGNWAWGLLLVFPCLFGGFSNGYSATTGPTKVLRRTIYAICVCGAGVVMTVILGGSAWMVLLLHVGVGAWSIWLGVKNFLPAAAEETFICMLLNLGLVMYPFIGLLK